ncbi:uncharacterized protein LOC110875946 [Helianthus annuus]|uniref:uncharacterized protein LOC110875946 n=1 Tax=Helianthus annuus TaxID=4232 RepID=UPI000B909DCE|nr:uncharacterized protein LOC110875946 [Helianthus annuus]
MDDNRDEGLENLGFQSFSDKLHEDVFISSKGPMNIQGLRDKPSLFSKPLKIDGNPLLPHRGVVQKDPKIINVIDELQKITVPVQPAPSQNDQHAEPSMPVSYADKLRSSIRNKREINFRLMKPLETREDADVVIPKDVVKKAQDKLENVLYDYFLGNRLPFPVVEYYAKNVWAKFGFTKLMMNAGGFFFFKFDTKEGMLSVLEGGPWLIRKIPLFLNIWTPSVSLKKDGIKTVPVWIKLHNVPLAVYTDEGLSLLASKLGIPKRLDAYTADMCAENWGRTSFARAMIEISADNELKDHIVLAIPKLDEEGYLMEKVDIEYEWKPHRCAACCLFGHSDAKCPKSATMKPKQVTTDDEGFVTDTRKVARHGFPQKKQKAKVFYRQKSSHACSGPSGTKSVEGERHLDKASQGVNNSNLNLRNSFSVLDRMADGDPSTSNSKEDSSLVDEFVKQNTTETSEFMCAGTSDKKSEGASTPGQPGVHGICKGVFRLWDWTSNGSCCSRGTRIIVGWNKDLLDLVVIAQSDQVLHVQIRIKSDNKVLFCSFVYAENKYQDRRALWDDLCKHKCFIQDRPWVVLGDFNLALSMDDSLVGPSSIPPGMREFYDCVQHNQLSDVKSHGLRYTWNQKPKNGIGVLKKIDRVISNTQFLDLFPDAYALFHPYRVSDHSPCILHLSPFKHNQPKPFKFANFLANKEGFIPCVAKEWAKVIPGKTMFSVVKKLSALKSPLRRLLFVQGNLRNRVKELREKLDAIQKAIDVNPLDLALRESEARCIQEFNTVSYDEECFLKQKSKAEWLAAGDSNTKLFHNCVKMRNACNKIHSIQDVLGTGFMGMMFLVSGHMIRQVTREEVKSAMFSIGENKAPGPDGYTSAFFKNSWDIVGDEVTKAVLDFFDNGKMLQQINHTIIALVPKNPSPNSVTDYRPISCCNVIYKCISKILTDRIKGSLDYLVDINQSAFVPGRKITDNILLTQELMHNYHLNIGPPRCAFKIDIQKAYDTVSWSFLEDVLHAFGFHQKMVKWIMVCVTNVSYSLSINGNLYGYFKGKRGLRQGDPISPYLFTLVMEVLTLLLKKVAYSSNAFRFHLYCKKQKIINVSFADDLFLFANGDVASVRILRDTLQRFTSVSGLVPSLPKSTVYFGNVPRLIK